MSRTVETFVFLLLIPALLEAIDIKAFGITIPGPLTLGRWTFILGGLISLNQSKNMGLNTSVFKAFFYILIGSAIGGFWGKDFVGNFFKITAFLLLILGAVGLAPFWNKKKMWNLLVMFMIGNFIYWSYHVIDVSYLRGGFNAYSTKFLVGDATNHHIVGQAVSVSSLFLAINYFFKYGRLSVPGYLILIWTLFILLLSETRSNFLITLLGSAIIVFRESKNFGRLIFLVIPLFFTVLYVFSLFVFENDNIKQRFDVNDSEYIEHTTDIRIVMLQEGLATFLSNPQGIGMLNMTVKINNKDLMLHNQYLSFLISGGLLALMGVLIWIGPLS